MEYTAVKERKNVPYQSGSPRDVSIEYTRVDLGPIFKIQVYDTDKAHVQIGSETGERKQVSLPRGKAKELTERLFRAGFFDFKETYQDAYSSLEGPYEIITLNWQGKSKKIICDGTRPSSQEFDKVLEELVSLPELKVKKW